MIKKPWRDDGSINYGEIVKITLLIMAVIIPLSSYFGSSSVLYQASPILVVVFIITLFIQQILFHYVLLKALFDYLNQKVIALIQSPLTFNKMRLLSANKALLSALFKTQISHLTFCVIRV